MQLLTDQYKSLDPETKAKYGEGFGGCKKREIVRDPDHSAVFEKYCGRISRTTALFDEKFGFKSAFISHRRNGRALYYASSKLY